MLLQWLRSSSSARRPKALASQPRTVSLRLEDLEGRTVPATTLTWTGQGPDDLWSDAANWAHKGGPDKTPGAGDALVFPAGARQPFTKNDIAGLTLASISFTSAGYDIFGNPFSLTGGITASPATDPGPDTIEVPVTIVQAQSFTAAAGSTLALDGGVHSDGPKLTLDGAGTVVLGGSSALDGDLDVAQGTLQVDGHLGVALGSLTVEHNATLTDAGSVSVNSGRLDDHGHVEIAAGPNGQAGGSLSINQTTVLTVESDGTLTDAGSVTVGDKGTNVLDVRGSLMIGKTGILDDQGQITVEAIAGTSTGILDDFGRLTVETGGVLNDAGLLTVAAGATLDDGGSVTVEGQLDGRGALVVEPGHTLTNPSGSVTLGDAQGRAVLAATLTNAGAPALSGSGSFALDAPDWSGGAGTVLNLSAAADFAPQLGQQFTLVSNGSGNPVQGHFLDNEGNVINEGDVVHVGNFDFRITYAGGASGQDVVLTNVPIPPKQFKIDVFVRLSTLVSLDGQLLTGDSVALLTPGPHLMGDPNNASVRVPFVVSADGTVSYEAKYEGALTGAGTQQLFVNGRKVAINASLVSASGLILDGLPVSGAAPLAFQALPGTYTLADSGNTAASVVFALNDDGTVTFDPAFQNVLTVTGGNTLTVRGARVTFITNALALATPTFTVNGQTYPTSVAAGPLPLTLLPGTINIQYTVKGVLVSFSLTLNPDGTLVLPDPSLSAYVSYQGNNVLTLRVP